MKKISLIYLLSLMAISSFGQQETPRFKVKAFKADFGAGWDKYQNMSLDWMQSRTNNQSVFNQDLSQKSETIYFSSGGGLIGGQVILSPTKSNAFFKPELRLGFQSVMGKEAVVEYHGASNKPSSGQEDIMYCFVENEVQTSAELLWDFGERRYHFYTGLGTNVSGSFGNDLYIFTNFYNLRDWSGNNFVESENLPDQIATDGKSVLYSRLYVPFSASVQVLGHLELSATYAFGFGVEKVINGDANTFRTGQFKLGLQYNIEQNKSTRFSIIDEIKSL